MKEILTFCMLLLSFSSIGQVEEPEEEPDADKFNLTDVITCSINGAFTVSGDVFPTSGTHLSFGLNPIGFFKKDILFGALIDFRGFKMAGTNRKYDDLTELINTNIIEDFSDPLDGVRSDLLLGAFNNSDFFGSYYMSYGVMFSPFPDKFGGLMLQVKKGNYIFPIYGPYDNVIISETENENVVLTVPISYYIQLTCKPITFFSKNDDYESYLEQRLFVSLFYEKI